MTGTHLDSSDATSVAWMNLSLSLRPSKARALRSLRFGSTKRPSTVPLRCRLRPSRFIHPSSSLSLSLSKATRSLAGEGRDRAAPSRPALRLRSRRFSSEDEGYGEWLLCRAAAEGGFGEGRWPAAGEDRADEEEAAGRGCLGLGGGGRSTTTLSMRILGWLTLNLFPLPRRGMARSGCPSGCVVGRRGHGGGDDCGGGGGGGDGDTTVCSGIARHEVRGPSRRGCAAVCRLGRKTVSSGRGIQDECAGK